MQTSGATVHCLEGLRAFGAYSDLQGSPPRQRHALKHNQIIKRKNLQRLAGGQHCLLQKEVGLLCSGQRRPAALRLWV